MNKIVIDKNIMSRLDGLDDNVRAAVLLSLVDAAFSKKCPSFRDGSIERVLFEAIKPDFDSLNKKADSKKTGKTAYGEHKNVFLSDREMELLLRDYTQDVITDAITFLSDEIEIHGYKYQNFALVLRKWAIDGMFKYKQRYGDLSRDLGGTALRLNGNGRLSYRVDTNGCVRVNSWDFDGNESMIPDGAISERGRWNSELQEWRRS